MVGIYEALEQSDTSKVRRPTDVWMEAHPDIVDELRVSLRKYSVTRVFAKLKELTDFPSGETAFNDWVNREKHGTDH